MIKTKKATCEKCGVRIEVKYHGSEGAWSVFQSIIEAHRKKSNECWFEFGAQYIRTDATEGKTTCTDNADDVRPQ